MVRTRATTRLLAVFSLLVVACRAQGQIPLVQPPPQTPSFETFLFDDVGKAAQSLKSPIRRTLAARESYTFAVEVLEEDTLPDILLTLSVTNDNGDADIFCNTWSVANQVAFPSSLFSIWRSQHTLGDDHVFISRNSELYVQESKVNVTVDGEVFAAARFVCSVVGLETRGTDVELDIDVLYETRNLAKEEMDAFKQIHSVCCNDTNPCPFGPGATTNVFESSDIDNEEAMFDFCHARGSFCNKDGRLLRLDLSAFRLDCEFPAAALKKMRQLRKVDINGNNLKGDAGEILDELSSLNHLERLSVAGNSLSGTLSKGDGHGICAIGGKKVTYLNLNGNNIQGEIPSCMFTADSILEELHLDANNFTGSLPEFSPDAVMEILSISDAGVSGSIPESLGEMHSVRAIRLSRNQLAGNIPGNLGTGPNLVIVDLSSNILEGDIPASFANSQVLRDLHLRENNLTGMPKAWINGEMPESVSLQFVDMRGNQIEAKFPLGLAMLPNLTFLNLASNNFSGPLPKVENLFPKTSVLVLSFNDFEGEIPEEFGTIGLFAGTVSPSTNQVLHLSDNNFTGDIPSFFHDSKRPSLLNNRIFLGGNRLSCPNPEELHSIQDLVCFTKCSCAEEQGKTTNLLREGDKSLDNDEEDNSWHGLSTGSQAAIGVAAAVFLVIVVAAVTVLVMVTLGKKRKWTTRLDEHTGDTRDIEVGSRF